jgi:hypothetical protein
MKHLKKTVLRYIDIEYFPLTFNPLSYFPQGEMGTFPPGGRTGRGYNIYKSSLKVNFENTMFKSIIK